MFSTIPSAVGIAAILLAAPTVCLWWDIMEVVQAIKAPIFLAPWRRAFWNRTNVVVWASFVTMEYVIGVGILWWCSLDPLPTAHNPAALEILGRILFFIPWTALYGVLAFGPLYLLTNIRYTRLYVFHPLQMISIRFACKLLGIAIPQPAA